jgi:hypothetical protein
MQEIKDAIIRVYIPPEYWETGVLWPYFEKEGTERDDECKPIFFRSDNCRFDETCRCYLFQLPQMGDDSIIRDVYIPEHWILGIAVRHGKASEENMRKIGFALGQEKTP